MAQAIEQIEESIANLRALITDLRPAALDELGIEAAIEALAERNVRHGLEVDVSIELAHEQGSEPQRMSSELESALYRITQEALTNAAKHGKASRAVVEIREQSGEIRLLVRDDGSGFDPKAKSEGFGLLGMHERVALLGGELGVESSLDGGTTIRAQMPMQRSRSGTDGRAVGGARPY